MARSKATVTLDRGKARLAMELSGKSSMSDVIDVALARFIHAEELRKDLAAYRSQPQGAEELILEDLPLELDLDDADIDYEALYGTDP